MSNSLHGKKICFTGKVDDFTRADFEKMTAEYGFIFHEKVTNATDILVVGKRPGATKMTAASKYATREWTAEDFIMMLTQDDADGLPNVSRTPQPLNKEDAAKRREFYDADETVGMF